MLFTGSALTTIARIVTMFSSIQGVVNNMSAAKCSTGVSMAMAGLDLNNILSSSEDLCMYSATEQLLEQTI